MSTIAPVTPTQRRLLAAIGQRLDQLDEAAGPAVTGILAAADMLPAADRDYVLQRLRSLGAPRKRWSSTINAG